MLSWFEQRLRFLCQSGRTLLWERKLNLLNISLLRQSHCVSVLTTSKETGSLTNAYNEALWNCAFSHILPRLVAWNVTLTHPGPVQYSETVYIYLLTIFFQLKENLSSPSSWIFKCSSQIEANRGHSKKVDTKVTRTWPSCGLIIN